MSTTDYNTTRFIDDLKNVYGRDNINAMIEGRRYFLWLNNMNYTDVESVFKNRVLYSNVGNWDDIQCRERILRSEAIQIRHLLEGRERFTRDIRGYYEYYADEEQEIENIIENLTRYINDTRPDPLTPMTQWLVTRGEMETLAPKQFDARTELDLAQYIGVPGIRKDYKTLDDRTVYLSK